jgi:hypothetical protein
MTGSCLVVMPFTVREVDRQVYPEEHWSEVYESLLRPAVELSGLKCNCDNDDFVSRPIALNIWKKIEEVDIILCDVSSSNPNVFMELGWAIRAEKPYVIVMDELTQAPFDVADFNRFHYDHALRPLALKEQTRKLARMLTDTLQDPSGRWSIVRNLGIASPAVAKRARPRCAVDIYYYEQIFTRKEAILVAEELRRHGIPFRLMEHSDPEGPDAAFIGSLVEADDARLIMGLVPYEVKFLFRPDYPDSEGGDSSGYRIGLGYSSRYNEGRRSPRAEPIPVTRGQLTALLSVDHTNTSFQNFLSGLTLRAASGASSGGEI